MIEMLSNVFFGLLIVTGIMFLITIIIGIIATPFKNAKKKQMINDFCKSLNKAVDEAIEELEKEEAEKKSKKTTKKATKKKGN